VEYQGGKGTTREPQGQSENQVRKKEEEKKRKKKKNKRKKKRRKGKKLTF
jgi:hypothetical protein